MNRKIQDSDREFIIARYRRDPYAFNARAEAQKHKVSPMTIYNVLSKAGLKMKRGRKPLISPRPLISPPSLNPANTPSSLVKAEENRETALGFLDVLTPLNPLDPPVSSKPPKPQVRAGKGPPVIQPPRPFPPGSPEYRPKKIAE